MHALIIVANVIAMNTTESTLVLEGCNTASAARAAEIAAMDPGADATLVSVVDLLEEPDGAVCLMETWTLVKLYHAQPAARGIVTRTLVWGLADAPHIAARAARLARVLGVGDGAGFDAILRRAEMTPGAFEALRSDIAGMHASPRKYALMSALFDAAPATATAR